MGRYVVLGYAIIGMIIGVLFAGWSGSYLLGAIGGAAIGLLLARVVNLDQRIQQLERLARQAKRTNVPAREQPAARKEPGAPPDWAKPEAPSSEFFESPARPHSSPVSATEPEPTAPSKPLATPRSWPEAEPETFDLSILQLLLQKITAWFTSGNVPVKVGVIISFIGVSFLLKYAIDRELMVIPLEFRLLAVAAAGLALVVVGWRLRERARVYALSLQGGGVGILFLTIFTALQLWQLLPAALAFFMLVALALLTGALAVLQNSRSLVILGVVGGFLAPILTSTGQGSHVVLFSYYLVLNGAILGIAWFRAWRELNLVGFVFTFLIGSLWGYQYYRPELLGSTQPFLVLSFLFYQAIAILYALRQPPERLGIVDGTLVFGTPVIVFALQAALVDGIEYGLAISAAIAAVFYALTATWLFRNKDAYLRLLTESFIALAVAFATLAIPLALDARWTSAAWALEGAALVWVGVRQARHLASLAGAALIVLSGFSFTAYGWRQDVGLPVLNGNVLGGVLISLSAFFASRRLESFVEQGYAAVYRNAATVLFVWAVLWWIGAGWMESIDRVSAQNQYHVFLLFLALSMGAGVWISRARQWTMLHQATFVLLPMLVLLAIGIGAVYDHFLFGLGWLAWPAAWIIQALVLRAMDDHDSKLAGIWHFASLLSLTALLAGEVAWRIDLVASSDWAGAVATMVPGIMAVLVWRLRNRPAWPVPVHPFFYLLASVILIASQVIWLAGLSMLRNGNPDPWPYIPVLNPFDLAVLFAMLTATLSLATIQRETSQTGSLVLKQYRTPYKLMLAIAFFIMTTFALVRGVHHYTGVNWDFDDLFGSIVVQTALSIYWGLLGFAGMIWGARSTRRLVWLTGTGFMALVVIKLFLIDLGNSGTIERIISFIGIGALLLVVGYFAPAPPRQLHESEVDQDPLAKSRADEESVNKGGDNTD